MGCGSDAVSAVPLFGGSTTATLPFVASVPFVVAILSVLTSGTFTPPSDKGSWYFVVSGPSSLMTLARAGRLASGRSVGADGDEGSSRGRFVDATAAAAAGGEADILGAGRIRSGTLFKVIK